MSSDLSGEFREYERTSTTVINAYLRPRVAGYLGELDAGLTSMGFDGVGLVFGRRIADIHRGGAASV